MSMIARTDVTNPSTEDWVNVFGPDGYNVQPDTNRHRKMGRVHLPDVLKVASLFRFCHTSCEIRKYAPVSIACFDPF